MSLRSWRFLNLVVLCAPVLMTATATAEPLLIRNGTLLTVTGGALESTDLLVEDGRITAIGAGLKAPAGTRVIDATGHFVMPGIVDTHSHMGVYPWPEVSANSDGNEMTDPISANMRAADAIWTEDPEFELARAGGVTTVQIIPGSGNLIGGLGVTLKLRPAADLDRMRFAGAPQGIKMALGENAKRVYGERKQMPSTRMGNMALFRDAFNRTLNYRAKWAAWNAQDEDERGAPPERDLELEVLLEVLDGTLRVHVHSYRKDGILRFLDMADEYGFAVASFQHCLEGYKIAAELQKRDIAVATFAHWWGYKIEAWDGIPHNAALLARDGVKVSIHSDSGNLIQRLYTEAAVAAHYGLSVDDALRAVTLNAAAALGVDDRIGSLEVGKDADLAIFSRHPLDVYTLVVTTIIDGEVVYQRDRVETPADLPRLSPVGSVSAPPPDELTPKPAPENPAGLYAIVGGRVYTMTGPPIEDGTVIVEGGKIKEVGAGLRPPREATVIDADGAWVFPGFIESHTALGLTEVSAVESMRDEDEDTDPVLPQLRALDAYNTESALIPVARLHGITAALTSPWEGNVFGGTGAIVRLDGDAPDAVTVRDRAALIVNFGERPKARYGARKKLPSTRMGIAALVRQELTAALDYRARWEVYENGVENGKAKRPDRDLKMEALLPALAGEIPVLARAHRVDDILTAVRLADEFGLRLVLSHATEAYKAAELLAQKKIPVVVGPISTQPDRVETLGAIYDNAARLHAAGVSIAIQTGDSAGDALSVRMLPYEAGLAVAYGLPWEEAIRALTVNPAEIFGVADRIGSLQPGLEANLFVAEGDPLQPMTRLRHLMIAGRPIPLTSRQTELYETWR